jgi:hypothetical protein
MSKWNTIDTAPANIELELSIFADGEYHALVFPCRRDGSGWREVGTNRLFDLKPTHWRPWMSGVNARPAGPSPNAPADK